MALMSSIIFGDSSNLAAIYVLVFSISGSSNDTSMVSFILAITPANIYISFSFPRSVSLCFCRVTRHGVITRWRLKIYRSVYWLSDRRSETMVDATRLEPCLDSRLSKWSTSCFFVRVDWLSFVLIAFTI